MLHPCSLPLRAEASALLPARCLLSIVCTDWYFEQYFLPVVRHDPKLLVGREEGEHSAVLPKAPSMSHPSMDILPPHVEVGTAAEAGKEEQAEKQPQ